MAGGVSLNQATADAAGRSRVWQMLALLLGFGSVLAWWLPAAWLDWQPELAGSEPWRAWSAAWVHWSGLHLGANLAGLAVVAALGWVARLPLAAALAWALAWPLTQAGLLWRPELAHYGGLSGVLHAGIAVAAVWLLLAPLRAADPQVARQQRRIGAGIAAGLLLKIGLEQPWGELLRRPADWDIAIAPLAHATGALAGALCALGTLGALALAGLSTGPGALPR